MKSPIIVICGPTAVGKTAVINQLLQKMPTLKTGISFMTRTPRQGMPEDKKVFYITPGEFKQKISDGKILEWSEYNGHYYGTSKESLDSVGSAALLLNLDAAGSLNIKKLYPHSLLIFIDPESMDQIRQRLTSRGLTVEAFERRWQEAEKAMSLAPKFDLRIINYQGRLAETIEQVLKAIKAYLGQYPAIDKTPKNN